MPTNSLYRNCFLEQTMLNSNIMPRQMQVHNAVLFCIVWYYSQHKTIVIVSAQTHQSNTLFQMNYTTMHSIKVQYQSYPCCTVNKFNAHFYNSILSSIDWPSQTSRIQAHYHISPPNFLWYSYVSLLKVAFVIIHHTPLLPYKVGSVFICTIQYLTFIWYPLEILSSLFKTFCIFFYITYIQKWLHQTSCFFCKTKWLFFYMFA